MFGFRADNLQPLGFLNTSPSGFGAGLWQSGTGLTADEDGLIYMMTGNSNAPGAPDRSNSFVQLRHDAVGGGFLVAGTFRAASGQPIDKAVTGYPIDLNVCDLDLSSSGPVHVPGTHIIIGGGKQGILYNIDTTDMAHPRQAFMAAKNQYDASPPPCKVWPDATRWPHLHGAPALWGPLVDGSTRVYMWAERDRLKGFRLRSGTIETTPFAMSSGIAPDMSMPGGVLSISADGGEFGTGIIWATRPADCPADDHSPMNQRPCNAQFKIVPGILKAFDAETLAEVWSSSSTADSLGLLGKFNPPTVAHGRVYVGTFGRFCCDGQLVVYGVRPGV